MYFLVGGMGSIKVNGDHFGYTLFFHGNAEQGVGKFHAVLVVGDHDDLRFFPDNLEQIIESINVGVVEWGIDFLQKTESRRFDQED